MSLALVGGTQRVDVMARWLYARTPRWFTPHIESARLMVGVLDRMDQKQRHEKLIKMVGVLGAYQYAERFGYIR